MEFIKKAYRFIRIYVIRCFAIFYSKKTFTIPKSSLILAPHPDDEVFGCAGLIQRILRENKKVHVIILTRGEGAYSSELIDRDILIAKRRNLALIAGKQIGLNSHDISFYNWPDGGIKNVSIFHELIRDIEKHKPDAIFLPHVFEGWSDHEAIYPIIQSLFSSFSLPSAAIILYNIWTWYSMPYNKLLKMNWKKSFILKMDKTEHRNKLKAINEYIHPLTDFGKPYSGILPSLFVKANQWNKELYFEQ